MQQLKKLSSRSLFANQIKISVKVCKFNKNFHLKHSKKVIFMIFAIDYIIFNHIDK